MREPELGGDTGIGRMQPTLVVRFVGNPGIVWHNGRVGGCASYLSIDPVSRSGTVALVNRSVGVTMLGAKMTRQVRTRSWSSRGEPGGAPGDECPSDPVA